MCEVCLRHQVLVNVGKTWLLRNLIIKKTYFDKLYIIGSIGDQYEDLESITEKADVEFIKDIKDIPFFLL